MIPSNQPGAVPQSSVAVRQRWQLAAIYGLAVLLTLATFFLRQNLAAWFGDRPLLILFTFPIFVSALCGGIGPGLVATLVAAACTSLFALAPHGTLAIGANHDVLQWSMLIANGVLASLLSESLHRSRRRETARQRELADTRDKLTQSEARLQTHIIATRENVQQLKRTEAALLDRDFKLGAIVNYSPSALSLKHPDGRYALANPHLQRIHHLSEEQIIGKTDFDLYPEDAARRFRANDERVLRTLDRHAVEEIVPVEDCARVFMSHIFPVLDAGGAARFVCRISLDITERRQTEEQLRKLAQAVEQNPVSILITNLKGEIEYVNEAFLQHTGYRREDVLGRNPRVLKSDKTPRATYSEMWQALSRGETWKGEFCNRRKDGRELLEFAIITPIRQADGHVSHYVGVQEDITERKRNAEELDKHRHHLEELVEIRTQELARAKTAAETANAAKSAFLANMSHEIRTPMNGILGMTNLMRRGDPTPLQVAQLDKIDASGKHLLNVINDILDLSKIEAGKLVLEHKDFALADIVRDITAVIGDAVAAKGLGLVIDVSGLPQSLRGDPTRLSQMLLNYLGNALKFTEHGSIALTGWVVAETDADCLLRFEVRDTGIGITPDLRDRLFMPFEQADNSRTRKYGGTGLGLAINRRIAQMMDGETGVDSAPGQGSTFWLTARLCKSRGAYAIPKQGQETAEVVLLREHGGKRVLLAEDEPVNQEVALIFLREAGLNPDLARDGAEALHLASMNHYDVILMDVQMPKLDGLAATREIRKLPDRAAIPILAMTATAFVEDREKCLAAGMNDFIAKPADPEALFAILLKWLSQPKPPEID